MDANAGSHEKAFATNFNPEINIREVTQMVRHFENGKWVETPAILDKDAVHFTFDYPVAGPKESYLLFHEEMESLAKNLPGLERMRFWMTFSENYLTHLRVMRNIGIDSIEPIDFHGQKIVPMEFLKALLPDPASLATNYSGKTVIGCIVTGVKDGKESTKFIYNVAITRRRSRKSAPKRFPTRRRTAHGCGHDGHAGEMDRRGRLQRRTARSRTFPGRRVGKRLAV